ncbi:peroxiredoxin [Deinococcus radiotolerans]|uniref:thioredoxin-dependent peroxiredoxin n=1 Tax=Deinococcus radiotolerans TaxID=1309407 RepID=A0ABQ2FHJ2_9DEIO|nr:peroxiredoxin [Deinococcus radiotolerans]GGK91109.1 peroxiredoxin [Deinococcus radiotolerans]
MALSTGDILPEFVAVQDNGRPYEPTPGRWRVLFFFPKTVTTHCQLQARQYQARLAGFEDLNVDVVGINGDPRQDQLHFRSTCKLGYPLVNDGDQEISRAFDLLDNPWPGEAVGRPKRETFLVDPRGVIRRHWTGVDPAQDAQVVLEAVQDIQQGETELLLA